MRADYVVIGGGVTGLAAAWALRRRGRDVTVLDQAAIGNLAGGSHGSCRIFRLGYEDPEYVTLARRAAHLWAELEQASAERLLHPVPQLTFGPQLAQVHAAMRAAGAPCELLSAGQAAERFSSVSCRGQALLEPDSAVIAADRALAVLAAGAGLDDDGARAFGPGSRVTALADDGRRVRISTSAGDLDAACAIVCAGPWTAALLACAGITIPAQATLEQVAYLAPARARGPDQAQAGLVPIFIHYGGDFPYGLPVPGTDRYKIGIHHSGPPVDPDRQDQAADEALIDRIEQAARQFLPGLDPRPVAAERCAYDNSPDTDFIVGRIGNVVIGSGTSGHGFKFGPLLGEWLATLATGVANEAGLPPERFTPGRF